MRAIVESDLPPYLRHFLHVLAFFAKSSTGVAWHGQETIAKAMGVSDRMVRAYFAELENHPFPVRVERRYRPKQEGRGRTSDEWRLVLTNRKPTSAETVPPTGNQLPVNGVDQPEAHCRPTGSPLSTNRKPTSGDLSRNGEVNGEALSVSLRSTAEGAPLSLPFAADAAGTDPEGAQKPSGSSKAQALKLHYVAEFKRTRGSEPDFRSWPRAMKAFSELAALKGGLEGAKAIVTRALGDEFTRRVLPWELVQDAPKHQGQAPRKATGRPCVQQGLAPGVVIEGFND